LPTTVQGLQAVRGVTVQMKDDFSAMTLVLSTVTQEAGRALGEGLNSAMTLSLETMGNIALGIGTISDNMRALGDTLRRLVAQLAVAVARAAALAALTTALSPLAGSSFGKSTFGAAFFRGLGIGGGGAASSLAVGEIRLRGSDIIASITAQQRIDRALS